ncbi:hypothetical protein K437DRAFT_28473 [Tilletiaria anomala UBC 951]|uniref:Uncharacterized protein n=1 Tax=Tilletiaria anomala (strain ATCC 24038 / CBS 436.72 / UBC 951) TaxID=1037660 RepID=A0A066V9Y9_TILAU|nr:uncharacterized protein K437DRAFT_28473 [Tilletiaria anomala UBC 951]KDN38281.1 hypothetical protein K437DRAFT_28473 [Tilletiaria anomala UBC 951]
MLLLTCLFALLLGICLFIGTLLQWSYPSQTSTPHATMTRCLPALCLIFSLLLVVHAQSASPIGPVTSRPLITNPLTILSTLGPANATSLPGTENTSTSTSTVTSYSTDTVTPSSTGSFITPTLSTVTVSPTQSSAAVTNAMGIPASRGAIAAAAVVVLGGVAFGGGLLI